MENKRTKVKCKYCGTEFEVTSSEIGNTFYCSKECYARDLSIGIDVSKKIAAEHNGRCLSEAYTNRHQKLFWECSDGHRWEATSDSVSRGTWCPYCAGQHKNIADMEKIASSRGGRCVSTEYETAKAKVLWECYLGHQWYATPDQVGAHNALQDSVREYAGNSSNSYFRHLSPRFGQNG